MRHHETRLAFNNQGENNAKRGTTFCKNTKSASSKSMAYQPKSNFTVQVGSNDEMSPNRQHRQLWSKSQGIHRARNFRTAPTGGDVEPNCGRRRRPSSLALQTCTVQAD